MKKWIISLIIGLLVISVGGGAYYYFNKKEEAKNTVVAATQTAIAEKGDVVVTVSGTGSISAINKETVTSNENGTVGEVLVEVGDTVEEGDELITFEGDIDPILAPFSGEITALNVKEEMNISPSTEMLEITNYKKLEMIVNVDELDISKVKIGQKAKVEVSALPDKEFTGTVTSVAKEANEDSTSSVAKYAVQVKISKPTGIKVGMTAEATITTKSKKDVLTIPVEAVQKQGDQYYVRIASEQDSKTISTQAENGNKNTQAPQTQRAQKQVEVGLQNDEVAEIMSGLSEGEEVVLPTINSDSNNNNLQQKMFQQGGFIGGGKMAPGGSSVSGGQRPSGTSGGSQGGNGN